MVKKKQPRSSKSNLMPVLFVIGLLIGGVGVYLALSGKSTEDELGLPKYAYKNEKVLQGYKKAAEYQDMLKYIPCYCGCGSHSGHLSVKNCFIKEDGGYDDHGANCEMCIDIVLEATNMYSQGKSIPEIRSYINSKYSYIGPPTPTPLTPEEADISRAKLPENFNSLSDALKLTPAGVKWAQFINVKLVQGTPIEPYIRDSVQPDFFYWKKIVGMYSADYSKTSWIELHDLGVEAKVEPRKFPGMDNVVSTRPFIYGHVENVKKVLELFKDPDAYPTAYETFKPVLENVKDEEAGVAFVLAEPNAFADLMYFSLRSTGDSMVERIVVYHVANSSALDMAKYEEKAATAMERGFSQYEVKKEGELLNIKIVGEILKVLHESV
jgi:hypothetical protein